MLTRSDLNNKHEGQLGLLSRLPKPSYTQFTGSRGYGDLLRQLLLNSEHDVVVVSGPAGIGKTSTINYIARELITNQKFDDLAWLTAQKPLLMPNEGTPTQPMLTRPIIVNKLTRQWRLTKTTGISAGQLQFLVKERLLSYACLVVIDNLETEIDLQEVLPLLRKWFGKSKFVVGVECCGGSDEYAHIGMTGFNPAGLHHLFQGQTKAYTESLSNILPTLRGNPLALKLAQACMSLQESQELELKATDTIPFNLLYDTLWKHLDDEAKIVLLGLIDSGEDGFSLSHLQDVCGLSHTIVEQSLTKLQNLALVHSQNENYVLHTKTQHYFLQKLMEIS